MAPNPDQAPVPTRPTLTIADRYEVSELLGSGGMCHVCRAWDRLLHVDRAVKLLKPDLAGREAIRVRFLREARTMAGLNHENIVTVHDLVVVDGRACIVMELLDAGSLADRVEDLGPAPARVAVELVEAVLRGLAVAHERGVIHRDVKPGNILLTRSGVAKLGDFGIARVIGDSQDPTQSGVAIGTLGYMAPEQRASARHADARSDLYAIGATLYHLVTGQSPGMLWSGPHAVEAVAALPASLRAIICRAVAFDPADRYPTAGAMGEALGAIVGALAPAPPRSPWVEGTAPPSVRPAPLDLPPSVIEAVTGVAPRPHAPTLLPASAASAPAEHPTWAKTTPSTPGIADAPPAIAQRSRVATVGLLSMAAVTTVAAIGIWAGARDEPAPAVAPGSPDVAAEDARPPPPAATSIVPPRPAVAPRVTAPVVRPAGIAPAETAARVEAAPAGPTGLLVINAIPGGTVEVDGRPHGDVPWSGEVPVGSHAVVVRGKGDATHTFDIAVDGGEPTRACWDFTTATWCRRN